MPPRLALPDPGPFGPFIDSFVFHLHAERKAAKTIRGYREAAIRFAGWLLDHTAIRSWDKVTKNEVKGWVVWMGDEIKYSPGYLGNQHRSLQQFFRWYSAEEE